MSPASASGRRRGTGGIPRPLLLAGVPLAAVLLTGFFVFLGFPYDRVRDALAGQLGRATGARVAIAELGPGLSLLGPALVAREVTATLRDGTTWRVERAKLRPAWSLVWLGGGAALAVDVAAPEGRVRGTVYAGAEPGFDGRVEDVELARLPADALLPDLALNGRAEGEIDLRSSQDGPVGRVALSAREGSIGLPGMPLALPYQTFEADLDLGDQGIQIQRLDLDGPMLAVQGQGTLGPGPQLEQAPLDLQVHFEVREQSVRPMIRSLGVRLGADGQGDVRLGGTLGRPEVRSGR